MISYDALGLVVGGFTFLLMVITLSVVVATFVTRRRPSRH